MGTEEKKHEFIQLRAKGYSYRQICEELNISKGTCANWSHELEAEINKLKAVELDSLYEEYYLLREKRIQFFGGLLKKLEEELNRRDFSTVSTERLMELQFKCFGHIKAEYIEPKPYTDLQLMFLQNQAGIK